MLGLILFLIYINDISDDLASLPLIYADDTTLLEIVDDPAVSAGRLNSDLNKIAVWADKWLVTMNPVKSRNAVFSLKRNKQVHPSLFCKLQCCERCRVSYSLGLNFAEYYVVEKPYSSQMYEKACKRLNVLKFVKYKVDLSTLTSLKV